MLLQLFVKPGHIPWAESQAKEFGITVEEYLTLMLDWAIRKKKEEKCDECSGKGYWHVDQETVNRPYGEIQACTECEMFTSDCQAAMAHVLDKCCPATLSVTESIGDKEDK